MRNDGYIIATKLVNDYSKRDMNEADTRHKIIDELLHNVLHWPKNMVDCERYIKPGFADYILIKKNIPFFLIEAKKENIYFTLPISFNAKKNCEYIKMKKLLSDPIISSAITQAREYCIATGIEYAAITNGHEWIIFKTFERGKDWTQLDGFVIKNLTYFTNEYTDAINQFGFTAVTEYNSLKKLLDNSSKKQRAIYFPKEKINAFDEKMQFNILYNRLDPIMKKFFGTFKENNNEFLEHCYIHDREYENVSDGVRQILKDSLSPYFSHFGVSDFVDDQKGGEFGKKIDKSSKKMDSDVIVLFGGKGVGKSTFLKKLLFYTPPKYLSDNSIVIYIDLLDTSESKESIEHEIWSQVIVALDTDKILDGDREQLIEKLFKTKFEIAKKQDLYGLSSETPDYNKELNKLVKSWKEDTKYCAERLSDYQHQKSKGIIIAIDNTDQFSTEIQDLSFTIAQELSKKLNCLTIISMREERFYKSTIHGTLDAYASSGFHISSPLPKEVFLKRIRYVKQLLKSDSSKIFNEPLSSEEKKNLLIVFSVFENEFLRYPISPLNNFLTACAHGDIRLALKLFRAFTGSGYTNVHEIVNSDTRWKLQIHQVLKPIMVPYRYFYDESQSSIPNIFQIRSQTNGSHFTSLRILEHISFNLDTNKTIYFSVAEVMDYFIEQFDMKEDFENNMDMLLKYRLVEADNRLDMYSDAVDKIKITTYGYYVLNEMSKYFTYLELICTDCGIFNEKTANELYGSANHEFRSFKDYDKKKRLDTRLAKVDTFISYLIEEEEWESETYNLIFDGKTSFSKRISSHFMNEKNIILRSAERSIGGKNIEEESTISKIRTLNKNGFRIL